MLKIKVCKNYGGNVLARERFGYSAMPIRPWLTHPQRPGLPVHPPRVPADAHVRLPPTR